MKLPMEVSRKLTEKSRRLQLPPRRARTIVCFGHRLPSLYGVETLFCTAAIPCSERMYQIACNGQPKGLSMTRYLTYNVPVEIFKRVGVRLLVMSASAAIGTLVKPGVGTTMVVLVVDFALMPPIYNSINRAAGIM